MTEVRRGRRVIYKKKNRGAVKGESRREEGEKRDEVDRIKVEMEEASGWGNGR